MADTPTTTSTAVPAAATPTTTFPGRPFMKAAGGKSKLAPTIVAKVPEFDGSYHEPFVGGGAVFLALTKRIRRTGIWAILGDANPELVNAYEVVKADAEALIEKLQAFQRSHSKENYYAARSKEETAPLERAARFLYLNKTCFNGLYRVNAAGKFNVPMGRYVNPTIVEPSIVLGWQQILGGAAMRCQDFEVAIRGTGKGDFIYADPPYLPRSKSADFTAYTPGGFGVKDHERLAASLAAAHQRGAKFLCSQGEGQVIRTFYKDFDIALVSVRHSVGARAASRVKVSEVLISNY